MKIDSGLELMLPGMYFFIMKAYQKYVIEDSFAEKGFNGLKREFIKDNDYAINNTT